MDEEQAASNILYSDIIARMWAHVAATGTDRDTLEFRDVKMIEFDGHPYVRFIFDIRNDAERCYLVDIAQFPNNLSKGNTAQLPWVRKERV